MVAASEIASELSAETVEVVSINNLLDKEEIEEKVMPVIIRLSRGGKLIMLHTIASILSNPAIILGIKSQQSVLLPYGNQTSDIIKGTLKTVFGFIMLQQGSNIIVNALVPFSTMFTEAFGLKGIVAEDNSLVAAVQVVLGKETALILLFSFLINLVIARITKGNIFLDRAYDVFVCRNDGHRF